MLTTGTRGEVQPLVALGLGLQAAGHQMIIATHGTFETFVQSGESKQKRVEKSTPKIPTEL